MQHNFKLIRNHITNKITQGLLLAEEGQAHKAVTSVVLAGLSLERVSSSDVYRTGVLLGPVVTLAGGLGVSVQHGSTSQDPGFSAELDGVPVQVAVSGSVYTSGPLRTVLTRTYTAVASS